MNIELVSCWLCMKFGQKRETLKTTKFCKKKFAQPIFLLKKVLFLNTHKSDICLACPQQMFGVSCG